jgi:hypothetical protein
LGALTSSGVPPHADNQEPNDATQNKDADIEANLHRGIRTVTLMSVQPLRTSGAIRYPSGAYPGDRPIRDARPSWHSAPSGSSRAQRRVSAG